MIELRRRSQAPTFHELFPIPEIIAKKSGVPTNHPQYDQHEQHSATSERQFVDSTSSTIYPGPTTLRMPDHASDHSFNRPLSYAISPPVELDQKNPVLKGLRSIFPQHC
jgi:hypothetical protein